MTTTRKPKAATNEIRFGKYSGKTFEEVFELDPDYLKWLRDTTDPEDKKNGGTYSKQNQARIKYIDEIFAKGSKERIGIKTEEKRTTETIPVGIKTFEHIAKTLLQIEEKLDLLLGKQKVQEQLGPDNEVPWDEEK